MPVVDRRPSPRTDRPRARRRATAAAVALGAALAGPWPGPAFAKPPDEAALLAAATPCCDDPSAFEYAPLAAGGSVDFAIDRSSPLFEFQSGPSFFRAFRLPAATAPYTIEIRSFLAPAAGPREARVLYPVAAILTDDFLVSRATDLESLRFDLPVLEHATAPAYRLLLPVDPAAARERYLVVFTVAGLVGTRAIPAPASPDDARRAAAEAYLGASPFGTLRITLRPADPPLPEEPAATTAGR